MGKEREVTLKFSVDDVGSMKLESIKGNIGKVATEVSNMDRALRIIKWDSLINIAERAYQAAERMYTFGKSVASAANDIERQSRILGLTTTEYQKLTYAAKMSDLAIEGFTTGVGIFSSKLEEASRGTGDAGKYLKAMGIDIDSTKWKTMSLSEKIGEVADQFKSWEEGERKIAISRELFGRSGTAWIEMLNKGKQGIRAHGDELVKMGGVLGEVTLAAGSAAENQFKDLDTRINAMKISLAPLVLEFAKLVTNIADATVAAAKFYKEQAEKAGGVGKQKVTVGGKTGFLPFGAVPREIEWPSETRFKLPAEPKIPPPLLPSAEALAALKKANEDIIEQNYKMSNFYQFEENVMKGKLRMLDLEKTKRESILDLQKKLNDLNKSALDIMEKLEIGTEAGLKSWIGELTKEYETLLGSGLFTGEELTKAREKYISAFETAKGAGGWGVMAADIDQAIIKFKNMTAQQTEAAKLKTEIAKLSDELLRLTSIVVGKPVIFQIDIDPAFIQLDRLENRWEDIRERLLEPIRIVIDITGTGSSELPIMEKIEEIYGGFEGMSAYIANLKFQMNLSAINEQIKYYRDMLISESMKPPPSWWVPGAYQKMFRAAYEPKITGLEQERSLLMQAQAYAQTGVYVPGGAVGGGVSINVNTMNVYGATSEEMVADMDEELAELWKKDRSKLKLLVS